MKQVKVLFLSILVVLVLSSVSLAGLKGICGPHPWDGVEGKIIRITDTVGGSNITVESGTDWFIIKHHGPKDDFQLGQKVKYIHSEKKLQILE